MEVVTLAVVVAVIQQVMPHRTSHHIQEQIHHESSPEVYYQAGQLKTRVAVAKL